MDGVMALATMFALAIPSALAIGLLVFAGDVWLERSEVHR